MTLQVHHLTGCAPAPLAHYLKALGILRLVAEQKDPGARGWWQDEHFCLLTELTKAELEEFFLIEYAPTPFVSPWNKGSGFTARRDPALAPVEESTAPRFAPFRAGIAASREHLAALTEADAAIRAQKDRTKKKKGMTAAQALEARSLKDDPEYKRTLAVLDRDFKKLKADLFGPYLLSWRGPHRAWMDAAFVWVEEEMKPSWASLLGTGGNDGRFDFTNNAMQRIGELFELAHPLARPLPGAEELLAQALWSSPSNRMSGAGTGQFLPGLAGGANSSNGAEGDSLVNGWDFLFMLEGAILFSARSTRRLDPTAASQASAPFSVRAHSVGHGTPGGEKDRGEQWMPLWERPAGLADLQSLLAEGRLQLGRRLAHRPIDVARALSRLGAARGVHQFVRFGYLERNGQSNFAVPLGRFEVRTRPRARLIDDLAPWLERLRRAVRDAPPARLVLAERALSDAVFAALTHDDSPDRWQAVLSSAAAAEAVLASGTGFRAGPIPPLSPEWLDAGDDGSPEWRLARALAGAAAWYDRRGRPRDPIRHHWIPLAPGGRRFAEQDRRIARDVRVVASGRDACADLGAVVERRLLEAAQRGARRLELVAARGHAAHPADLALVIAGGVDLSRVSLMARALMALRWERAPVDRPGPSLAREWPEAAWMVLRLACLPWPILEGRAVPADEAIIRRLLAGDAPAAVEIAVRRLAAAGLRGPIRSAFADVDTARRWAAGLAFPISPLLARQMASRLDPMNGMEIQ